MAKILEFRKKNDVPRIEVNSNARIPTDDEFNDRVARIKVSLERIHALMSALKEIGNDHNNSHEHKASELEPR